MKKLFKNEKGFTLVELLAVLVILGIIAAIAVPAIGNVIQNSKEDAVKAEAVSILESARLYKVENPDEDSVDLPTLKSAGYIELADDKFEATGVDATVSFANGVAELTTSTGVKAGNESITFNGASIQEINSHENGNTIPATGE